MLATDITSLDATLRITEIFFSLQGETSLAGLPTVFVRLTGCPLRCVYCDTEYAFHGGQVSTLKTVFTDIQQYNTKRVCVTGGEPLAQPNCIELLKLLCDKGYLVSLETSGAMDISQVDDRVKRIVDIKTPGSQEVDKNRFENVEFLSSNDEVKFVLADRSDYEWSKAIMLEYDLTSRVSNVLFSPVFGQLDYPQLAAWILEDGLPVRMQIQMHKLIWNDEPGR